MVHLVDDRIVHEVLVDVRAGAEVRPASRTFDRPQGSGEHMKMSGPTQPRASAEKCHLDGRRKGEPRQTRAASPHQNHLLDALPAVDYQRIAPQLELVPMSLGEVLYESGARMRYVYFPTTCIISLLYVMEDGASAEMAIVGNEGMLGISLFMGGETTPSRAVVQSAGHAFRLKADLLKDEFGVSGRRCICCCATPRRCITQMAQTAVCNRHHSVDQQLCRWLLLSLDRLVVERTLHDQELIANMLAFAAKVSPRPPGSCRTPG